MTTVCANGRAIAHKGDGQTNTSAPPDVCKTPTPGGPVPIPYVNLAMSSHLANGTTTVQIEGHAVAIADSNLCQSSGDEPGTAGGGLMSSKTKGKLTWGSHSSDVLLEGKGVVRFMDVTQHNGNSFNTAFVDDGHTGLAYGDDFDGECPACHKDPEAHPHIKEEKALAAVAAEILKALRDKPHRQSCMVAVGRCKCGKLIAAASGTKKLDAFQQTVTAAGCGATTVLGATAGGTVSIDKLTAPLPMTEIGQKAKKELKSRWDTLTDATADKPPPGHTRPGQCAAQKVLGTGHAIIALSEAWYQAPEDPFKPFSYKIRATFDGKTDKMEYESIRQKANNEKSVAIGIASCKTCQVLIPFMLCEARSC